MQQKDISPTYQSAELLIEFSLPTLRQNIFQHNTQETQYTHVINQVPRPFQVHLFVVWSLLITDWDM